MFFLPRKVGDTNSGLISLRGIMEHIYSCTGHELKIPNIIDSQGVYLFDDKGKRFMDLESGVWCISIGHKNEQIRSYLKIKIRISGKA
jgi:acetylornithine aminotransferase